MSKAKYPLDRLLRAQLNGQKANGAIQEMSGTFNARL
jgi:hypothetical protein